MRQWLSQTWRTETSSCPVFDRAEWSRFFFSQLWVEPTRFVRIIDGSLYAYAKPTYPLYHVS